MKNLNKLFCALLGVTAVASDLIAAELSPLFGDGVHDDTEAIQRRLDSGRVDKTTFENNDVKE